MSIPEVNVVVAAIAKRGDTVIVGLSERLCDEDYIDLTDALKPMIDQVGVHVALIEGASSMVVVRPEPAEVPYGGQGHGEG